MSQEIVLTLIVPLCIVSIGLLGFGLMTKFRQWRRKRTIERGITDLVRRVRS